MHQSSPRNIASLDGALRACKRSFVAIGVFSFAINILMLTPMFYMINVYDKAVATGSGPTLFSLVVIAAFLYVVLGFLEWIRSTVLVHIAIRLDKLLSPRVYELCFEAESGGLSAGALGAQPLADLNSLRQFLAGPTAAIVFDLPWIPFFLLLMFFFHPALAMVALICMMIMTAIAIANQRATTKRLEEANNEANRIGGYTQRNLRNAEVASAMGIMTPLMDRWRAMQDEMLVKQAEASNAASGYGAAIKTLNMAMQSVAITAGAILAMAQEISPGVMIGAALLLGKTLQPIQQAVSSWGSVVKAKEQYVRLDALMNAFPPAPEKMPLPKILGKVQAENVFIIPPGAETSVVNDVSFTLDSGTTTMLIGPSGAGKSTLVRAILGIWPVEKGKMTVDGADVSRFARSEFGPQIGYLPQDIELFDGTIAQNISRFLDLDSDKVVQAAIDSGVHDLILGLPEGYDTLISGQKGVLSPGQRQRIALARALYDRPKLLVLDEPNSNLDESGEAALAAAMQKMKSIGSTIILVSHRQGTLPLVDNLIVMNNGAVGDQGPKDEVIARVRAAMEQQAAAAATSTTGRP